MGSLRSAGDTFFTAIASSISTTIVRTMVSFFFGYTLHLGIVGVWFGIVGDQLTRYILSVFRFKSGKWVNIKI